ncbi:MAG TPA: hypothetical protein PKC45_11035 [Gemmatales bacterium]|nr:hypothetical protein [Gemmatales bacterium]
MSAISGAVGLVGSEAVLILAACGLFLGAPFKVPGVRWRLAGTVTRRPRLANS